jgi:hypothetical protein
MAKGKKTIIREIKKVSDEIISINGKEYVIIENTSDIEKAIAMKITSHGNRILKFEDDKKKATLDVKRDIEIIKYTILDEKRAQVFRKTQDKKTISMDDKKEIIATTTSFIKAREIINSYKLKTGENYDKEFDKKNLYISSIVD